MNRPFELFLNFMRSRVYPRLRNQENTYPDVIMDATIVKSMMINLLDSKQPCMIARYGAFEVLTAENYINIKTAPHSYWKYITGEIGAWWWQKPIINLLKKNAGFYPITEDCLCKYSQLMYSDSADLDLLAVSQATNKTTLMQDDCPRVGIGLLEPDYFANDASSEWTSCLKGKKVLVVHPFAETIKNQYKQRTKLFPDPDFLPEFELMTVKAVQSIGGYNPDFPTWFDALKFMEDDMDKLDYDIAIIGCGAYGFNLAAHAKRTGHKAIHLGGATQILFGIRGKRWENREDYRKLMNEYWVRPPESDKPKMASSVEGGCYW